MYNEVTDTLSVLYNHILSCLQRTPKIIKMQLHFC
jgi:hypothetical protein